jgi:hypothetical protein
MHRRISIPNLVSVLTLAALALARSGDTIRAAIELNHERFATAVELLQTASAYEMGAPHPSATVRTLYPIYLGAEALLKAGQSEQAMAEFQKVVDHRRIVQNFVGRAGPSTTRPKSLSWPDIAPPLQSSLTSDGVASTY